MIVEIKIPTPGESITEVELGKWLIENGNIVSKNQEIAEIESDKATLTLVASEDGKIEIITQEGEKAAVGSIACKIDTSFAGSGQNEFPKTLPAEDGIPASLAETETKLSVTEEPSKIKVTAVAQKMMDDNSLSVDDIIQGLQRIGKKEVSAVLNISFVEDSKTKRSPSPLTRDIKKEKMTLLRRKLSERLVAVKNETAMLTTFNEADMSRIMEIRAQHQNKFVEKHGFKLGFMSFFTKAVATAMQYHPAINSMIDGDEILTPGYVDVGIAVQTPKGLMVPIVRNAEKKSIADIELEIKELAERARSKKISVAELTGGTFTITNGGTFGSLLSTPIINPPQSAILGMHNIVDRPIALNGQVVIRPMMYVALSYDHRIIDGKDSVGFLVKVKELVEHPEWLLTEGKAPDMVLLGL